MKKKGFLIREWTLFRHGPAVLFAWGVEPSPSGPFPLGSEYLRGASGHKGLCSLTASAKGR